MRAAKGFESLSEETIPDLVTDDWILDSLQEGLEKEVRRFNRDKAQDIIPYCRAHLVPKLRNQPPRAVDEGDEDLEAEFDELEEELSSSE